MNTLLYWLLAHGISSDVILYGGVALVILLCGGAWIVARIDCYRGCQCEACRYDRGDY